MAISRAARRWRAAVMGFALTAGVGPVAAHAQTRDPIGGLVGDLRLLTTSLPTSPGWTPAITSATAIVPGRGFGAEGAAHVTFGPGRYRRLGVGVSAVVAQGRATGTGDAPTVTTRMTAVAPHLSMNFGHRLGWSYFSAGAGLAKIRSEAAGADAAAAGWDTAIHYGFGARWFLRERVAVSLDLRFWALTPRPAEGDRPRGRANTRVALGAGVAFR